MAVRAEKLSEKILEFARRLPEGAPVQAKGLLHLGTRAGIDQALSRLAKRGELLRVGWGVYVSPMEGRFGKRAPSVEKTVAALAEQRGECISGTCAMAANALGFTTQVPVRSIFLTSGRSRCLRIGKQEVELRRAPSWQVALGDSKAGQAIRALVWLGRESDEGVARKMSLMLTRQERKDLARVAAQMPVWLAGPASRIAHG